MNKSIYNIGIELQEIFNEIEYNDGIISAETETALAISQAELQTKGINYGYKCLELDMEIHNIETAIERLILMKKNKEKSKDYLKNILSKTMKHFGILELKTSTLKVNFRKSESVEVTNEDLIAIRFKVEKITNTISKNLIKEAIKAGEIVIGAELVTKENLQIK